MAAPNYSQIISRYQGRQDRANQLMDAFSMDPSVDENLTRLALNEEARKEERRKQDLLVEDEAMKERIKAEEQFSTIDVGATQANDAIKGLVRQEQKRVYNAKILKAKGKISGEEAMAEIQDATDSIDAMMSVAASTNVILDDYYKRLKIQPGEPGAIDVMTPDGVQKALLGIRSGDSRFVKRNGQFFAIRENPDGGAPFVVNLTKATDALGNGEYPYKEVPDVSKTLKGVYDNTVKPGGKDNAEFVMFETKRIGDQEAQLKYMTPAQRTAAANAMVKSNQFKGIIEDEDRMSVIWSNMMGRNEPWGKAEGSPEEIEAKINKQKEEAALFLANKALDDNAAADGVKIIQSTKKYTPPKYEKPKTDKPRLTVGTEEDINTYRDSYQTIVQQSPKLVGKPKEIIQMAGDFIGEDPGYYSKEQLIEMEVPGAEDLSDGRLYKGYIDDEGTIVEVNPYGSVDITNVDSVIDFLARARGMKDGVRERLKKQYKPGKADPTDDEPLDFQATKKQAKEKKQKEEEEKTRKEDIEKAEDKTGQFPTGTSKI